MEQWNILDLSNELLEQILICTVITEKELTSLAQTCKRWNQVTSNNELWKKKLFHRWPKWFNSPSELFYNTYKERSCTDALVKNEINKIVVTAFHLRNIPNKLLQNLYKSSSSSTSMILESLFSLANVTSEQRIDISYYAKKLFNRVFSYKIKTQLLEISNCKDDDLSAAYNGLEEGIKLISQMFNPVSDSVSRNQMTRNMDGFAELLQMKSPVNDKRTCLPYGQALDTIKMFNDILFNELLFSKKTSLKLHFSEDEDEQKEIVLQTPVLLCCFYINIAKRCGFKMKAICLPGYFIVCYNTADKHVIYIDVFKNGRILNQKECCLCFLPNIEEKNVSKFLCIADKREIFTAIISDVINIYKRRGEISGRGVNAVQTLLELIVCLSPTDDENRLFLTRLYLHQGVNFQEAIDHLTYLLSRGSLPPDPLSPLLAAARMRLVSENTDEEENDRVIIKLRSAEENLQVQFRIGMVMRHTRFNYNCVIYGWDNFCDMPNRWQRLMGVQELTNQGKQPFYNVLVDDGTTRYASQESLKEHPSPKQVNHEEIGRYFQSFNGSCYLATEIMRKMYPED